MNIYEKLLKIQTKLTAPKSQYNDFGKYAYRNNEDILNALKPFLDSEKVAIVQSDEMVQIGDRYYIKATSELIDADGDGGSVKNTAYARETETKKGMDSAQITGAASSYARKYSLNGLFAIDDSRDPDTGKPEPEDKKKVKNLSTQDTTEYPKITKDQSIELYDILTKKGYAFKELMSSINKQCKTAYFNLDDITTDKFDFIKTQLEKLKAK